MIFNPAYYLALTLKQAFFSNYQFHFISLLFFQILENKLEYKYTADQIIDSVKKMNLTLLEGYGYILYKKGYY